MIGIICDFVFIYMLTAWPIVGLFAMLGYYSFAEPFYEKEGKDTRVAKRAVFLFWILHPFIAFFYFPVIFKYGGIRSLIAILPNKLVSLIWIVMGRNHGNFLILDLIVVSLISFLLVGAIWYLREFFWPSSKPLLRLSRFSEVEKARLLKELKQLRINNEISAKEYLQRLEEYEKS